VSIRSQEQVALLTDYDTHSAYGEAYYTLLANIHFGWKDEAKVQTLLVTTPDVDSGHAAATANIAIASAQSGMPTLLVDADFHEANLEQRFGLQRQPGFSDLLVEKSLMAERIAQCIQPTFVPALSLLSAGSVQEEAELLMPTMFECVMHALREYMESTNQQTSIVLFNSSPVLTGPVASIISSFVAQTVLLIARKRTTRKQAKQAQAQLQRARANLTGLVLVNS
jgi:capsular exopolysaccharide synthesis family protein